MVRDAQRTVVPVLSRVVIVAVVHDNVVMAAANKIVHQIVGCTCCCDVLLRCTSNWLGTSTGSAADKAHLKHI